MQYEKNADYIGYLGFVMMTEKNCPLYNPIPHFHNSTEILIIAKGEYNVYTSGERRVLKAGSINFVESFKPHSSGSERDKEALLVYVLVISDTYLSKVIGIDKYTFPPFLECEAEAFSEILELTEWGFARRDSMNEEMKFGFITSLFGIFKKHFPFVEKSEEKSDRMLMNIMSYISEHYTEEITLEILSRKIKYESTYISRTFNSFFGMSLREYLNRYRISEFLKKRLKDPDVPTCKLAKECGFISENTFYRALNKYSREKNTSFDSK